MAGQYRLKANAGRHHHDDGRTYGPGEIVRSDHNLALIFREKFETVDGPQPVFVGPQGGRTGNEQPSDHAGRDVFETDQEADEEAKANNANLGDNDGVDKDEEDIAENIARDEDTSASAGRPKRNAATTAAARRNNRGGSR